VQHPRDAAGVGLAEADAQALHGLDQILVARRAVEQALECLLLRGRRCRDVQHVHAPGAFRDVFAQRIEGAPVLRSVGQQVGAFADHRGAERLERAQHAHARRRVLGRQLRHRHEPVVAGLRDGLVHAA
jgi:hypothetical protein